MCKTGKRYLPWYLCEPCIRAWIEKLPALSEVVLQQAHNCQPEEAPIKPGKGGGGKEVVVRSDAVLVVSAGAF